MEQQTHWKKLTNPDYIGAYAFNRGEEKILTIKMVKNELVTGSDGKKEQCTVARFEGGEKPMILNRTNCKTITKIYKTPFIEEWQGKSIQIYVAEVKAFGEIVEALRIRPFIPQTQTSDVICNDCNEIIQAAAGKTAQWVAAYTQKQYGTTLCAACAEKRKQAMNESEGK